VPERFQTRKGLRRFPATGQNESPPTRGRGLKPAPFILVRLITPSPPIRVWGHSRFDYFYCFFKSRKYSTRECTRVEGLSVPIKASILLETVKRHICHINSLFAGPRLCVVYSPIADRGGWHFPHPFQQTMPDPAA